MPKCSDTTMPVGFLHFGHSTFWSDGEDAMGRNLDDPPVRADSLVRLLRVPQQRQESRTSVLQVVRSWVTGVRILRNAKNWPVSRTHPEDGWRNCGMVRWLCQKTDPRS